MKGRGFIIDMDGVIYRDSTPIPGAVEFINRLVAEEVPFTFVTNNSQRTRRDVCHKLRKMGMNVEESHVFTCAMATARFISEKKPNGTAYVIGEGGLLAALHMNGYTIVEQDPDFVIVGEGRTFSAESMEKAVNLVLGGASLIATNLDPNCPTKTGTRPGCGAMVSMLEKATGIQAFSVGKPSPVIMRMARKEMGLRTKSVTVIGDTMETDILGGVQMGYRTLLVLTGGTKLDALPRFAYRPDLIIPSIAHLLNEQQWREEVRDGDDGEGASAGEAEEDFSMAPLRRRPSGIRITRNPALDAAEADPRRGAFRLRDTASHGSAQVSVTAQIRLGAGGDAGGGNRLLFDARQLAGGPRGFAPPRSRSNPPARARRPNPASSPSGPERHNGPCPWGRWPCRCAGRYRRRARLGKLGRQGVPGAAIESGDRIRRNHRMSA